MYNNTCTLPTDCQSGYCIRGLCQTRHVVCVDRHYNEDCRDWMTTYRATGAGSGRLRLGLALLQVLGVML